MTDRRPGGTRRRPSFARLDPLERLEIRRLLAAAVTGAVESTHLVGCACSTCGGGDGHAFYEQPLTAEEKRTLHGDDQKSAAAASMLNRATRIPPTSRVRTSASTPTNTASPDSTPGAEVAQRPSGALSNRILFTAAGHGFTAANTTTGNFTTQRGLNNGMVEDMGNYDQMTQFVHYAWNAGATI